MVTNRTPNGNKVTRVIWNHTLTLGYPYLNSFLGPCPSGLLHYNVMCDLLKYITGPYYTKCVLSSKICIISFRAIIRSTWKDSASWIFWSASSDCSPVQDIYQPAKTCNGSSQYLTTHDNNNTASYYGFFVKECWALGLPTCTAWSSINNGYVHY